MNITGSTLAELAARLAQNHGMDPEICGIEAARIIAVRARSQGWTWKALRDAFAGHPELQDQVPDKPGLVNGLPLLLLRSRD